MSVFVSRTTSAGCPVGACAPAGSATTFPVPTRAAAVVVVPAGAAAVCVDAGHRLEIELLIAGEAAEIESAVVAAVLLFRALTFLLQVILGVVCYMAWRWEARRQKSQAAQPS